MGRGLHKGTHTKKQDGTTGGPSWKPPTTDRLIYEPAVSSTLDWVASWAESHPYLWDMGLGPTSYLWSPQFSQIMHLALEAGMQRPALLCSKIRSVLWLFMWASADLPWPVGQSWPATCFCTAPVFRVGARFSSGCCIAWALLLSLEAVLKDKDQSGCPWGTSCTFCLPGPHALAQIHPAGLCHCHFNKHWHFPYLFQTCWHWQPSYRADRIKLAFFNVHGSWKDI